VCKIKVMPNFRTKIFVSILLFFLGFTLFFSPAVFSQETVSFENILAEYNLKNEEYKKARSEYLLKRGQYLKFRTLKSEADAYEATLAMLELRDDMVVFYLLAIEKRLTDSPLVSDERRATLNFTIIEETAWFKNHRDNLVSAGTLENLVKDSDLAKERYEIIEPLAYEIFATISFSKLDSFYQRMKKISLAINEKIEGIVGEEREEYQLSVRKQGILGRWIFESDGRIARGEEKKTEAENFIFKSVASDASKHTMTSSGYSKIVVILGESRLFLNEASSLLKEIIREVKIVE